MNILTVPTNGYTVIEAIVWIMVVLSTIAIIGVVLSRKETHGLVVLVEVVCLSIILLVGIGILMSCFTMKGWI